MPAKRSARRSSVVLVGRPNVGKSTLFNRLTGSRRSIVTAVPGTTRDVIAAVADWQGWVFDVVDTGGMFGASEDPLRDLVVERGRRAISTADIIVFVVDGREGLVSADEEVARVIRSAGVPILLAVNKMDDRRAKNRALEFYRLGFEPVVEIAAEHGTGVAELLDEITQRLPSRHPTRSEGEGDEERGAGEDEAAAEVRVAIVGRPNVGKSSLVNRLLKEERVMVSEMPGTTRDAVDALLHWHRRRFRIVDTAGIRRPGRVARSAQVEAVSVIIAKRAIEEADVAVLVLDATQGVTDQDAAIAGEADRKGCGVILVANKWDLMKDQGADVAKRFDEEARRHLKFLDYAPLLHVSALTGERAGKVLETIDRVADSRRRRVSTGELNRFIEAVTSVHSPTTKGKRDVRILYAAQTGIGPPTIVLFTNVATELHFSYERFLVNRLRETFGFEGTPIRLLVRRRSRPK